MIARPISLKSKHKRSFFQRQSTDEMTLRVSLFSNIGCILNIGYISSIGHISNVGLRVVVF